MSKLPSLTGREIITEVVSISMIREELSSIPNYDLPPSFSVSGTHSVTNKTG